MVLVVVDLGFEGERLNGILTEREEQMEMKEMNWIIPIIEPPLHDSIHTDAGKDRVCYDSDR